MKKQYTTVEELIRKNLGKEYPETKKLIKSLQGVKRKGYFTKEEFVKMGMWKSYRPKQRYLSNNDSDIISISKKVLATKYEKRKIELLTRLNGVSIPVASAILALIDPRNYGVIDIRVWQVLYLYGSVKDKPKGVNFDFNNWYAYLMRLRYYAKKLKASARDVERTIFEYHKEIQEGNLYK